MFEKDLNIKKTGKLDLGLYIHIPFCIKKCAYCDFLSFQSDEDEIKEYVEALIREIKSYQMIARDYYVKTIFIGGGTPSAIAESYIKDLISTINKIFDTSKITEITIESNPGTLTKEKLETYLMAGINRLSIGLQSTDNEELKLLGRIHTYEEFEANYKLARKVGFKNINVDLMSSLPDQSVRSWVDTLQKVIDLKPEHISAYSLIIEEETPFYSKYEDQMRDREQGKDMPPLKPEDGRLPSEEEERAMYYKTKQMLKENGYVQYEISNYSKVGYECKHNSSYWSGIQYIGFGLGASSLLKNIRYQNEDQMDIYKAESADYNNIRRNMDDLDTSRQMEEFMFLGLRMCKGILKSEFQSKFEISIELIYGEVLNKLHRNQLLTLEGDTIALTEKGIDLSNYVLSQFLIEESDSD